MYKKLLLLFVLFCLTVNAKQLNNSQITLNKSNNSFFIQNKGQWDPEVKYLAHIRGMNAWITNSGVVYDYYRIKKNFDESKTLILIAHQKRDHGYKNSTIQGHVVKMKLVNSENNITAVGNNQREGYYNYFIGNDPNKWASYVPLYDNVELQGVYKNIDVKYYYDNGMLRYDYKAKPGADLSQIKLRFDGQGSISISSNGELLLKTSIGEITNGKIYAYQMEGETQKEVSCKFEQKEDGTIGIKTDSYDANKEIIIDPLVYSTFIGGNADDYGNSIKIDDKGNTYITGYTNSINYPTSTGAYQKIFSGGENLGDAFVTELNSTGSDLIYSTFIGGKSDDVGTSIALDQTGNSYITGYTSSSDYPITDGAYQSVLGSVKGNGFVTKLNATGSALVYSTYLGGGTQNLGNSIAVDVIGNAYITGSTGPGYPTTTGVYQNNFKGSNGTNNAFVTKLNSSGSDLIYSTYIGGDSSDVGTSIVIDGNGNAYITGNTHSPNYPTTGGAYQIILNGNSNAFITKLNSNGSTLVYSTYVGGDSSDIGNSIAVDASGNAYITGATYSSNYPTTVNAFQSMYTGLTDGEVFITKLNSAGTNLIYSSFIGPGQGTSIKIDINGNAILTGWTASSDYPITSSAFQDYLGYSNAVNAFLTEVNSSGNYLVYSTYIGGTGDDFAESIDIDNSNNAFITGSAFSSYPITGGAYQITDSVNECFVTKINFSPVVVNGQWEQTKGLNGRTVYCFAASGANLLAGTDNGIFLSTNNGSNWTASNTGLPNNTFVSSFIVNGTDIFAGTNTGIYHSTNNGTTWTEDNIGLGGMDIGINALAIEPDGKGSVNLFAGTADGLLHLSTNNGAFWTDVNVSLASPVSVLFVSPNGTGGTNLFAGTFEDILLITLTSLEVVNTGLTNSPYISSFAMFNTETNTQNLFAGTEGDGILLSKNYGKSWMAVNLGLTNLDILSLTVSGQNLFAGTDNGGVFLSENNGSWTIVNTGLPIVNVMSLSVDGTYLFAGTNGKGVWRRPLSEMITAVKNQKNNLPTSFYLQQNYPNPFNPSTTISYSVPKSSLVTIKVYDILGREIKTIINEEKSTGNYSIQFNGNSLPSGIYFYRMQAGSFAETKKLILMK